ncbi:MAG TPA: hypothetical protein VK174_03560, partial [Chitinophagales bacterium]|nr:hypothetical protein [Chitinophagales bacterium]
MTDKSGLLTIQKFVFLLDDFHYQEFCHNLEAGNAALSLKLVKAIHNKLPAFDTHEELCIKIYDSIKQKQNFNQLSSYTFKLSYLLGQNYPNYLHHNVSLIERLVNDGETEAANFRGNCLQDIAEEIEDFQSLSFALKFLTQQAFLTRDSVTGFKLNTELEKTLGNEQTFNRIIHSLRTTLYVPAESKNAETLAKLKDFYRFYHNYPAVSIRILSMYAYLYTVYYFNPGMFDSEEDLSLIKQLDKELVNNSHVVFPFLFDIKGIFGFLLLNSPLARNETTEGKKHFKELTKHYSAIKFWKNYLNMPQIFSIAVQATRFVSTYHYLVHRSDYNGLVQTGDMQTMKQLSDKCAELLELDVWKRDYKNDLVSVQMLYGALLVLQGGPNIRKGIEALESLLTSYQQLNLSGSTDSVFLALMIGYFATKKYDKCADTFKRYQKVIKDKPVYDGNDISIHTYYYLSRWLESHSKQYITKLEANYQRAIETGGPQKAIEELVAYFKVPMQV